jgi:TolB-like protein/tetratricopeptide (TPR) repeat protein
MRLLGELKRRRVLNTASLYVVGAWLVLQVMDVLEGFFAPTAMRWVLIGFAVLYPVVLAVGWFFDVSRDGIRRTGPLPSGETAPPPEFLDHVQLAGHVLVIGFVGYLVFAPPVVVQQPAAPTAARSAPRAIAVLAFEDVSPASEEDRVGEALAEELREELTRTAGLKVMGPKTSELLLAAGDARTELAAEMDVTALLHGTVRVQGDGVTMDARVINVTDGQPVWQASFAGPLSDVIRLQQDLLRSVIGAVAPTLDPDPVNGPRTEAGQCSGVYEQFLRGKQLLQTPYRSPDGQEKRARGAELIREATELDPDCAVAWEALAHIEFGYELAGFAKAGVAARRALELNDDLPVAWAILGEIAEQEMRWSDAEEYFLRAISADPTNIQANGWYAETLMARGRVREGLRHILQAWEREPASYHLNWRVMLNALYAREWDLVLKHSSLFDELRPGGGKEWVWFEQAYALLKKGEHATGLAMFDEWLAKSEEDWVQWYSKCVRAWLGEGSTEGLPEAMAGTWARIKGRKPDPWVVPLPAEVALITCDMWVGDGDLAADVLLSVEDVTELQFFMFFWPDAGNARQHPRFKAHVKESGLMAYWREWGWADMCEPVGEDDFTCR